MTQTTPVSEMFQTILTTIEKKGEMTLGDCVELLQERSIFLILLLFSLLNIPVPGIPGFSTVTGIPIILLGFQVMTGSNTLWLPKKILAHPFQKGRFTQLLARIIRLLQKIEKYITPRLLKLSESPVKNLLGLVFIIVGALLALPIPFGNFPAGLCLSLLAIGLIERDGAFILAGLVCAVATTIITVLAADAFGKGLQMLFS